jgi:hypothetical protein
MADNSNTASNVVTPTKRVGSLDLPTPDSKKKKGKGKDGNPLAWQRVLDTLEAHKEDSPRARAGHPQTLHVGTLKINETEEDIFVEWPKKGTATPEFRYWRVGVKKGKGSDRTSISVKITDIELVSIYGHNCAGESISGKRVSSSVESTTKIDHYL